MDKVIFTTITDPMMGFSYEMEPIYRKLETHFGEQIKFRYVMGGLVRDVYQLIQPQELTKGRAEGIRLYNARLTKIYEEEEKISGMPIDMRDFHLFSEECTSSLSLNLAYKAAELTAPKLAEQFLYNLRYATIVERRQTTLYEEQVRVAELTGINKEFFERCMKDWSVEAALQKDLMFVSRTGIHSLPAVILEYDKKAVLMNGMADYEGFSTAIRELTGDFIKPKSVEWSEAEFLKLLERHPLINPIEVREAFNLPDIDSVKALIQPLEEQKKIKIQPVYHGWFIKKEA